MYLEYFGLEKLPFTISPDPDFLYPSKGHQEALAHLSYALTDQGGLICLTGEVGTGKTMLCRALMESVPEGDHIAYIFNPQLSPIELMQSLCDDLGISYDKTLSLKELYGVINDALVAFYAQHQRVICVIDEAQAMPPALLEQIRLLTNLETHREKLLTLVLVGQPELRDLLARHDLRQLNQRITARYHLDFLSREDTAAYLEHRLACAGSEHMLFDRDAVKIIWESSHGTPRLINSIADRALLGAYATESAVVGKEIARQAVIEVTGGPVTKKKATTSRGAVTERSVVPMFASALLFLMLFSVLVGGAYAAYRYLPWQDMVGPDRSDPVAVFSAAAAITATSCDDLKATGYECINVDWSLVELKELKQKTALQQADGSWYMLSGSDSDSDSDSDSGSPQSYSGNAVIFWQPPVPYESAVKPGQTSEVVRWVRSHLGITWDQEWTSIGPGGVQVQADPDYYDPLLERAVAEFQIEKGLKADRIIGPKTLMYMQAED